MQIDLASFGDPERPLLSMVQRTLILRTFGGFKDLTPEELVLIASIAKERHFAPGEVMHEEGKPVTAFHFVLTGDVQMYRKGKPQRVLTGRSTVGALAALARDPRGAHAVAVTDVVALEMNSEDMDEIFEDNFGVIQGVLTGLGVGLREFQIQAGGGAAVDMNKRFDKVDLSNRLTLVDKMFILRGATNFSHISLDAMAQMARDMEEMRFKEGDEIWKRGSIGEWSMLVVDGIVECSPESMPPFELGPSFFVGGMDSITSQPRWYGCHAKTEIVALRSDAHRYMDMLEDHAEMALEMTRNLAMGLVMALEKQMDHAESIAEAAE